MKGNNRRASPLAPAQGRYCLLLLHSGACLCCCIAEVLWKLHSKTSWSSRNIFSQMMVFSKVWNINAVYLALSDCFALANSLKYVC